MNQYKPKKAQEPEPDPKPVQQEPRVIITQGAKDPSGEYMLIGQPSIATGSRIINAWERVSEAEWKTFPEFIRARFWKIGDAIPVRLLAKQPTNIQKFFKPK